MHAGMRNAWPCGRAAVCTSQPVSETRVCLWCTIAAISGRCRRFSYCLQSSGSSDESRADHSPERISATIYHTSTPPDPLRQPPMSLSDTPSEPFTPEQLAWLQARLPPPPTAAPTVPVISTSAVAAPSPSASSAPTPGESGGGCSCVFAAARQLKVRCLVFRARLARGVMF